MPLEYDDFDLEIAREGEGFVARVAVRGMGEAQAPFPSPFQEGELDGLLAGIGIVRRDLAVPAGGGRRTVQEIGQRLFAAVFGGRVRIFWENCLRQARQAGKGLRLHLRLRSSELWDWPWEYLFDPDADFLALLPDVSIVRYPELPHPTRRLRVDPPLRVLVATAHPRECRRLGVEREWEQVKSAWESIATPGRLELVLLEGASLAKVRRALRRPFHIFHFIGHGELDAARRQGVLLFEKGERGSDPVTGQELIRVLQRQPALRLVVLNTCEGARAAREDPFSGVAQRLVHGRIPAVVAMQFRIADDAAIIFSRHFYETLAEGMPVDAAVSEARLALVTQHFEVEWGNPVLYMRSPDGQIFTLPPLESPSSATIENNSRETGPKPVKPAAWRRTLWAAGILLAVALGTAALLQGYRSLTGWKTWRTDANCPSPPGLAMAFARIEPGSFTMGADESGDDLAHRVTLTQPFCIGRFEVSQEQWKKVMGGLPRLRSEDSKLPAANVSWRDAQAFIAALNRLDPPARYRLPTEAQWEYASRAGAPGRYSFGDDPGDLRKHGNCRPPEASDGYEGLAPVGSFRANPWGLYDLYGNVTEWVEDWMGPYPSRAAVDPAGPSAGTLKVRRGGSFNYTYHCDSTYRTGSKPGARNGAFGLRVVRDPLDRLTKGHVAVRRSFEALRINNEGAVLAEEGRDREARQAFTAVLRLDPHDAAAHANLAGLEEKLGNYSAALFHAEAAVEDSPDQPLFQYNFGRLLVRLGDDARALGPLQRATELTPCYAQAFNELGSAYLNLARPADARRAIESGLHCDRGLAPLYKHLGRIALAEGRLEEAVGNLEEAVRLYARQGRPDVEEPNYWLAEAHAKAGRRDLACRQLEKLRSLTGGISVHAEAAQRLAQQERCEGVF